NGDKGRNKFLSFRGGYHGDTIATMSVCDPEKGMHSHFKGFLAEQVIADLPVDDDRTEALERILRERGHEIAAIITEPLVQGAAGMVFHDDDTLRRIRTLADKHNVLLIVDEIFTGFGRLGHMFACDKAGIVPDIMTVSKALTGGFMPLSAAIARTHVFEAFWDDDPARALMHGPTYMGHALACAAANASLDLYEKEPRLQQIKAIEAQMQVELGECRNMRGVKDVRVMGAIGVVQFDTEPDLNAMKAALVSEGVWLRPFRDIVYLTPAYTIESDDLSRLTGAIKRVVAA
ncbi:MAG: aminotransferase class III-fold pyridoxal phosphate-dependent enzyme, partial [Sphingomonadales bacterium]|nr:aminotransferase class III-fold pyridoxal phosphate-dependent enzyme [Sphingomonadales bacterium]